MPSSADRNFRRSFDVLLSFALRKGVPFEDAQELVQASIVAALDRFDEGKGAYLGYCTTILGNRIKNYWRDRKPTESIDDVDIPDPGFQDDLEREEERARMTKMIRRISRELTPEEAAFLKALGVATEELESRAVSHAARLLGLEPEKGWDIFRRIQRKAKTLFPDMILEEVLQDRYSRIAEAPAPMSEARSVAGDAGETPLFSLSSEPAAPGRIKAMFIRRARLQSRATMLDLARWAAGEESFRHVMGSLTGEQMKKLRALFT